MDEASPKNGRGLGRRRGGGRRTPDLQSDERGDPNGYVSLPCKAKRRRRKDQEGYKEESQEKARHRVWNEVGDPVEPVNNGDTSPLHRNENEEKRKSVRENQGKSDRNQSRSSLKTDRWNEQMALQDAMTSLETATGANPQESGERWSNRKRGEGTEKEGGGGPKKSHRA